MEEKKMYLSINRTRVFPFYCDTSTTGPSVRGDRYPTALGTTNGMETQTILEFSILIQTPVGTTKTTQDRQEQGGTQQEKKNKQPKQRAMLHLYALRGVLLTSASPQQRHTALLTTHSTEDTRRRV